MPAGGCDMLHIAREKPPTGLTVYTAREPAMIAVGKPGKLIGRSKKGDDDGFS